MILRIRRSRTSEAQILLVATAGLALTCWCRVAFAGTEVGDTAPALVVSELNDQPFDLSAMRGKVVIVNFWATWCPPCREEMPALNAFYQRHHAQGLEMIGLSADRPHDRGDVVKVMQSLSYPAAMLEDAKSNGFGSPSTLPTTYVIDAQGVVHARLTPDGVPVTEKSLDDVVLPLLPNRAAAKSPDEGRSTAIKPDKESK